MSLKVKVFLNYIRKGKRAAIKGGFYTKVVFDCITLQVNDKISSTALESCLVRQHV